MTDPSSISEWVTFWVERVVSLLTSPASVALVALVLLRQQVANLVARLTEAITARGGTARAGPLELSVLGEQKELQLDAAAARSVKVEDSAAREALLHVSERIESSVAQIEESRKALRELDNRLPNLLAQRVAERATAYVDEFVAMRKFVGSTGGGLTFTASLGRMVPQQVRVRGEGDAALAATLIRAVMDRDTDFTDAAYDTWLRSGEILRERGVPTSDPPFSRALWDAIRGAPQISHVSYTWDEG